MSALSPLSGVMRKSHFRAAKTVFDPKATFDDRRTPSLKRPSLLHRIHSDHHYRSLRFFSSRHEAAVVHCGPGWCDGMAACRARGVLKPISRAAMIRSGFRKRFVVAFSRRLSCFMRLRAL